MLINRCLSRQGLCRAHLRYFSTPVQEAYKELCDSGEITADPFQVDAISSLSRLQVDLSDLSVKKPKGAYMYGGVGCGKTFMVSV
jgi:predicted ATPase